MSKKPTLKPNEVTDDQGRQRFHGAFTGGFSAGYYNTVGSEEGWKPSTFVSSRAGVSDRDRKQQHEEIHAERRKQNIHDFMDEEDGVLGGRLGIRDIYDTLGLKANRKAEHERGALQSRLEQESDVHLFPAGLVTEVDGSGISSSSGSGGGIGKRLLQKCGWKDGQGVGARVYQKHYSELLSGNPAAAGLRPSSNSVIVTTAPKDRSGEYGMPVPKRDMFGIGWTLGVASSGACAGVGNDLDRIDSGPVGADTSVGTGSDLPRVALAAYSDDETGMSSYDDLGGTDGGRGGGGSNSSSGRSGLKSGRSRLAHMVQMEQDSNSEGEGWGGSLGRDGTHSRTSTASVLASIEDGLRSGRTCLFDGKPPMHGFRLGKDAPQRESQNAGGASAAVRQNAAKYTVSSTFHSPASYEPTAHVFTQQEEEEERALELALSLGLVSSLRSLQLASARAARTPVVTSSHASAASSGPSATDYAVSFMAANASLATAPPVAPVAASTVTVPSATGACVLGRVAPPQIRGRASVLPAWMTQAQTQAQAATGTNVCSVAVDVSNVRYTGGVFSLLSEESRARLRQAVEQGRALSASAPLAPTSSIPPAPVFKPPSADPAASFASATSPGAVPLAGHAAASSQLSAAFKSRFVSATATTAEKDGATVKLTAGGLQTADEIRAQQQEHQQRFLEHGTGNGGAVAAGEQRSLDSGLPVAVTVTRSSTAWTPASLLLKRFNVKSSAANTTRGSDAAAKSREHHLFDEHVGKYIDPLVRAPMGTDDKGNGDAAVERGSNDASCAKLESRPSFSSSSSSVNGPLPGDVSVTVEPPAALPVSLFKSIFEDSDDEEEEEEEKQMVTGAGGGASSDRVAGGSTATSVPSSTAAATTENEVSVASLSSKMVFRKPTKDVAKLLPGAPASVLGQKRKTPAISLSLAAADDSDASDDDDAFLTLRKVTRIQKPETVCSVGSGATETARRSVEFESESESSAPTVMPAPATVTSATAMSIAQILALAGAKKDLMDFPVGAAMTGSATAAAEGSDDSDSDSGSNNSSGGAHRGRRGRHSEKSRRHSSHRHPGSRHKKHSRDKDRDRDKKRDRDKDRNKDRDRDRDRDRDKVKKGDKKGDKDRDRARHSSKSKSSGQGD